MPAIFWKTRHALVPARASPGRSARAQHRAALLLALPWVRFARPSYGTGRAAGCARSPSCPGQAVIDAVEVAALAVGSVQHRTLFL